MGYIIVLLSLYWAECVHIFYYELQWVLLATIKSGDYEKATSILQEKYTDLDLNCQDYVCKLAIYSASHKTVVSVFMVH